MEQLGVSVNQAPTDLNRYLGSAPHSMVNDKIARTYVRGPDYAPQFPKADATRILAQLRPLPDGMVSDDTWIAELPPYDAAPTAVRGVNPITLRFIVGAIRRSEVIEVKYPSLSRPEPCWRWVASHTIGFEGVRLHTRAFCLRDEEFKDVLLSRIMQTRGVRANEVTAATDIAWQEHITLEIGTTVNYLRAQKKVIALDYGMSGGKAKIKIRCALLYYALKRLRIDANPGARKPQDQPIVLLNAAEVTG